MIKTRTSRNVAGLAATALLVAGCSSGQAESTSEESVEGSCTAERQGGTVTMAMGSQPKGLDPWVINGTPSTGGMEIAQIYDTLMQYDPETGEYEPRVAKSLEHNEAFDQWTLGLRPDVEFGNGDPLTAEAVKASIKRFQSEENSGTYRNLGLLIKDMKVVDSTTLVFTLEESWAGFPFALANTPGMIVNTKIAQKRGDGFLTNVKGAGVGAYEATTFTPGEEIVLTAKKDYWDGPVCIEKLRFIPVATDNGKYEAFRAGEAEAAWLRSPLIIDDTKSDGVKGITKYQNAANVLMLNSGVRDSDAPTEDVRVRQAIAHAIDVKAVDMRQNQGTGSPTSAILGENSNFYTGAEGPQLDRDQARDLLDQAKSDGYDGSLRMICPKSSEEAGLAMAAQLKSVGFDVDYETLPDISALIEKVIIEADFDTSCFGLNLIDEGLWPTLTNSLSSESPSNYGGLKEPRIDKLLSELRVASSTEEVGAVMADLQEVWNEVIPAVVLNAAPNRTIRADNLHNLQATSNSLVFFSDAFLS